MTETLAAPTTAPAPEIEPAEDDGVIAELLVQEISIDGMCGVY